MGISDQLMTLIAECDKIIADTTGRLEAQDESQLFQIETHQKVSEEEIEEMPEEGKQAAAAEITEEVVNEQIKKVCKAAEPETEEAFLACVKMTKARLQDM